MARAAKPRIDRRALIARALYDCIGRQGYANTSLTEIADQAKMTPGHVSYYFDNKAAILEYFSAGLCEQILAGLPDLRDTDPGRLADSIADFCFGRGQQNTAFLGVIQEVTGLAVHDARLKRIKSNHSTAWRKYFEAYFERTPPSKGLTAREAARIAHAVLIGLDTNTLFDRGLSRQAALELFRRTLKDLSNLEDDPRPGGDQQAAGRRRRAVRGGASRSKPVSARTQLGSETKRKKERS